MDVPSGTYLNYHKNPLPARPIPLASSTHLRTLLDTPQRFSSTNETIGSQDHTHETIDYLVAGEIQTACFKGITRLEETRFPDDNIAFSPAMVFEDVKVGDSPLYRGARWEQWPRVSSGQASGVRETALAECMNNIAAAIGRIMGVEVLPRKWSAKFCNTPVKSKRCKRKPDVVLMEAAAADSSEKGYDWTGIFGSGEDKGGRKLGKAMEELAQCVRLIFGTQPDRIFVLGFVVHRDNIIFVVFNRSGAFLSDSFNVHKNPERLIRLVGGMVFASREQIGFDPTMKVTMYDEIEPFTPYVELNGNSYEIVELLHVECVIRGRATVCFKVKKRVVETKDGKTVEYDKFFVVKNGWVDKFRPDKEPDILGALNEKRIKGVPTLEESQIFEETTLDIFLRMATHLSSDERQKLQDLLEQRQQVRVVMGPVGSSILEFKSLKELVHGFLTIVKVIESLYENRYLHRDVSVRNLLFNDEPQLVSKSGLRDGLLIDFDYAAPDDENRTKSATHRTGTLPFMSVELLMACSPVRHQYYHELESAFLDLCFVCCICAGPCGTLREDLSVFDTPVGKWFGKKNQSASDIGAAKYATMHSLQDFEERIIPSIHPYFKPLVGYLKDLRDLAVPPLRAAQEAYRRRDRLSQRQNAGPDESDDDNDEWVNGYTKNTSKKVDRNHTPEPLPLWLQDMDKRDPKEFFRMYKSILRDALRDEEVTSHIVRMGNALVAPQHPRQSEGSLATSVLLRLQQVEILDDVPERIADLVRPPSPCSGKRKAGHLDNNNCDTGEDVDDGCPPSPLQMKWGNGSDVLPFRLNYTRSLKQTSADNAEGTSTFPGNKKPRIEEEASLEGN